MIVSCLVDPACFGPRGIVNTDARKEAMHLLENTLENGVFLDTAGHSLLLESVKQTQLLGTGLGQRVSLLLQEIRKSQNRYDIEIQGVRALEGRDIVRPIAQLAGVGLPDVIVTIPENMEALNAASGTRCPVILLEEYTDSSFESFRRKLRRNAKPLDELRQREREERLKRTMRYTDLVRFFDYRMIASEHRAAKFLAGIRYFVDLWNAACIGVARNDRRVELITTGNTQTRQGFLSAADARARLETLIAQPLRNSTGLVVHAIVKRDQDPSIFHARGYEARGRVFPIDPGFDGLGPAGPTRRCLVRLGDDAELQHFVECRNLPDAK